MCRKDTCHHFRIRWDCSSVRDWQALEVAARGSESAAPREPRISQSFLPPLPQQLQQPSLPPPDPAPLSLPPPPVQAPLSLPLPPPRPVTLLANSFLYPLISSGAVGAFLAWLHTMWAGTASTSNCST